MSLIYYILHCFKECEMEDLEPIYNMKNKRVCKKCGREYFMFGIH